MEALFSEKTEGSISGIELKQIIMQAAEDQYGEGNFEAAAIFYKEAAEIEENRMYKHIKNEQFYEYEAVTEEK